MVSLVLDKVCIASALVAREEADRFLVELQERLVKFGLEPHPEKTRLIEFGRYAAERRAKRGEGKPETFNRSASGWRRS
jgi:hypothetical protein